jgi:hypothetical protein
LEEGREGRSSEVTLQEAGGLPPQVAASLVKASGVCFSLGQGGGGGGAGAGWGEFHLPRLIARLFTYTQQLTMRHSEQTIGFAPISPAYARRSGRERVHFH